MDIRRARHAGLPVMCEKPLALSAAAVDPIAAAQARLRAASSRRGVLVSLESAHPQIASTGRGGLHRTCDGRPRHLLQPDRGRRIPVRSAPWWRGALRSRLLCHQRCREGLLGQLAAFGKRPLARRPDRSGRGGDSASQLCRPVRHVSASALAARRNSFESREEGLLWRSTGPHSLRTDKHEGRLRWSLRVFAPSSQSSMRTPTASWSTRCRRRCRLWGLALPAVKTRTCAAVLDAWRDPRATAAASAPVRAQSEQR